MATLHTATHVRVLLVAMPVVLILAAVACAGGVPRWPDPDPLGAGPVPGIGRYEADVSLDLETQALSATWRIAYLSDSATADAARFVLHPGLTVTEVRGPDVARFHVEPPAEDEQLSTLVVEMDTTLAPGTLVALEIRYAGRPGVGEGMINDIAPTRVELNLDGFWHPVAATFDQRLVGIARLRLPENWEVVAPGAVSREEGVHVVRTSVPQVDVAFIAAPRFRVISGVYTTVYHQEADGDAAVVVREIAESCGAWLNERFAARDSLTDARIVLTARPEVGYARGSYIVLSRVDPTARVGLARYLCHELAHTWAVSANFMSPHHWMSEAFAEFVAARFVRERHGDAEYARIVAQWESQGGAQGPVWTTESTSRPGHGAMYRRAPLLLHQLEERIGRERFERFLTLYMVEGARTTPDLLAQLRTVAGSDAERWFRDALARAS